MKRYEDMTDDEKLAHARYQYLSVLDTLERKAIRAWIAGAFL